MLEIERILRQTKANEGKRRQQMRISDSSVYDISTDEKKPILKELCVFLLLQGTNLRSLNNAKVLVFTPWNHWIFGALRQLAHRNRRINGLEGRVLLHNLCLEVSLSSPYGMKCKPILTTAVSTTNHKDREGPRESGSAGCRVRGVLH